MDTSNFDNAECRNPNHDVYSKGPYAKPCPLSTPKKNHALKIHMIRSEATAVECITCGVSAPFNLWQSLPRRSDETQKIAQLMRNLMEEIDLREEVPEPVPARWFWEWLNQMIPRIESIGEVDGCERCDHEPDDECDCKCHSVDSKKCDCLQGSVPDEVWVAKYLIPYRSCGTYTPDVYRDEPKELNEVEWVLVPVRTVPLSEENPHINETQRIDQPKEALGKFHEAWTIIQSKPEEGCSFCCGMGRCINCGTGMYDAKNMTSPKSISQYSESETQTALNVPCMFCGMFPKAEKDGTVWCEDVCWNNAAHIPLSFPPKKWIKDNGDAGWKVRELRKRQGDDVG